jgi:hypothetical protein
MKENLQQIILLKYQKLQLLVKHKQKEESLLLLADKKEFPIVQDILNNVKIIKLIQMTMN